ncbi:MAG: hypothetical protein DMD35_12725 [Gemmatimonadetes bacterium]|nr:MAG: hypothetical protein DMD35_12725 [Gemmatimonadota bacterium]
MRKITLRAVHGADAAILDRARAMFGAAFTLADVLAAGRAMHPPLNVSEIVTQDEYTHDVVVPFGPTHYLSFDTS